MKYILTFCLTACAVALAIISYGGSAHAAKPMTYACSFVSEYGPAIHASFHGVDLVAVDLEAQSLHFQVSSTMKGGERVDWTYNNQKSKTAGWPDDKIVFSQDKDGTIYALSMRFYTMFTFSITKTDLVATAVSEKGIVSQARFRCTRRT